MEVPTQSKVIKSRTAQLFYEMKTEGMTDSVMKDKIANVLRDALNDAGRWACVAAMKHPLDTESAEVYLREYNKARGV